MFRARPCTSMPDAPHRTKLRMLGPTCAQTRPLRHVRPQLDSRGAQVGANWPQFSASYAQLRFKWAPVRPNLSPRTAKFYPSRLLVGPNRPAFFLSVSYSLGAGGSRREATRIHAGLSQRMRQKDISNTSEDETVDQMNEKLMCHSTLSA